MEIGRSRKLAVGAVVAAAASLALAGTGLATPASGVTFTTLSRATLPEPVGPAMYNVDGIMFKSKGPVDVVTQTVSFAVGGTAGWHGHAGGVFVSVVEGTLTVYDEKCERRQYGPGQAFFERGPHVAALVRNEGSVAVQTYATWIVPVGANPLRTEASDPGCGVGG